MSTMLIKKLWMHEAIRARPGMYLGEDDRCAQAAILPPVWGLIDGHGIILNALSSRILLQTSNGETRREAMYSRGGIISPMMDLRKSALTGTRVVFEFDPLFFDADALFQVHSDAVIDDLRTRFPWLTVSQRAADVTAGDPW